MIGNIKKMHVVKVIGLIVLLNVGCARRLELNDATRGQLIKRLCPSVSEELLNCEADFKSADIDLQEIEMELLQCKERLSQ